MKNAYQTHHTAQLEKILAALPKSADSALVQFTAQFYAKVPVSDLERFEPQQAVAIALSAYDFIASRDAGAPKIRIFTPTKKEYGYDSKHSVIELLNDDMPFLVDSLTAELTRRGFSIRETIHPILKVKRDKKGALKEIGDGNAESLIHFELSFMPDDLPVEQLKADLEWVLEHIRAAVADWHSIEEKARQAIVNLSVAQSHFDKDDIAEVGDFLRWLLERNFVFMGYAEYDFYDKQGGEKLAAIPDSRLGILKITDDISRGLEAISPEMRHLLLVPQLIEITKSSRRSPIHRPVPMDYIGLKRFDAKGKVIGEVRFLGLFTSNVYYQSAEAIPLVRQKIAHTQKRAGFDPLSHDGKALRAILEFLPRDEIFQMSEEDLLGTSMGILALEAKPGVRIFVRKDAFERFVSCMVFVPRERFSTELRKQIQVIVERAWSGTTSAFSTQIIEAPLARLQLTIKTTPGDIPAVDLAKVESQIARSAYMWSDQLLDALASHHPDNKARNLHSAYVSAFPQSYINRYDSESAIHDIGKIEEALSSGSLSLELFHTKSESDDFLHLKIYNPNEEIALSDILPMLENAGFRAIEEHPFLIAPQGGVGQVWIRDFKLHVAGAKLPLADVKTVLEEALLKVWRHEMESDRFNALVLRVGLGWRQVTMLRALAKYLRQIGFSYVQATIEQALNAQPHIAKTLVQLFEARFTPDVKDRESKQEALQHTIEEQLVQVSDAVQDHILRRYGEVMLAAMRTNYFQKNESPVLSFKFDSARVPELPLPRPYAEIFVYGTRVEGIHLRGGKVARGGLRWSDRHDDFRTEVLGLMKAQMVKNSVIVPVGSKGGFVVKRPPVHREAMMEEGVNCYKMYLRGLLDITDNIVGGKITSPLQTVRHDGDDPYLVVAADKGTASFSDIANGVSAEYGFWLGDAFASGGSAGYDHKKMAITARGAWVSVVRHFHEMGADIEAEDFTVAGIGDMSGDVFGNGMILSDRISLVAAFNHMHIVIDPSPDAKKTFAERKRLFELPRSTWKDYDAKLLSKGGAIYERSAKTISLGKEAQTVLGVSKATFTPDELIRAILVAPVDLLWNGGIGTYVKAEDETHEQVGDRTNNAVRVNGKDLRCKVVGEGGNLGFTQKGRIEYARTGGRINTDAIDNSAGVDCSDHEVNIKIAFAHELAKGSLTMAKRDKQLTAMTEDVAQLVLKDNILQTQAISIAEHQGVRLLESQERLMHTLERSGLLSRAIEFLPGDKQIAELKAARKGLTRPELAVLLAYSKMELYHRLLHSTLPDEPYFTADLKRYFPKAMQRDFEGAIAAHPLKREIIATVVTNSIVNRAGITFFFDIAEDMGVGPRDVACAYTLSRDAFQLRDIWKDIEVAKQVPVAVQAEMYAATSAFLERVAMWLLRHVPLPLDLDVITQDMLPGIAEIGKNAKSLHSEITQKAATKLYTRLMEQNVPEALAEKIAGLELLSSAFDIISVAKRSALPTATVGKIYFQVGEQLRLGWLRVCVNRIVAASYWERLALQSIVADLYDEQRRITASILESTRDIGKWTEANKAAVERYNRFIDDLKASDTRDIPKLMVALRHVRSL